MAFLREVVTGPSEPLKDMALALSREDVPKRVRFGPGLEAWGLAQQL